MTDQPTTPLPGEGRRPLAWDDPATRRSVNQSLRVAILSLVVAVAAIAGCLGIVLLGHLGEAWGLGVLVAVGGVGGGALAGGVAMLVLWTRTRALLRQGPWVPGRLTLGDDYDAELAMGGSIGQIRMGTRAGSLGDPEEEIAVDVRSGGARLLFTVPPSRRILRARTSVGND